MTPLLPVLSSWSALWGAAAGRVWAGTCCNGSAQSQHEILFKDRINKKLYWKTRMACVLFGTVHVDMSVFLTARTADGLNFDSANARSRTVRTRS